MSQITVKERERIYRLIIGQLMYDGYYSIAASLKKEVNIAGDFPPSDKLTKVAALGMKTSAEDFPPLKVNAVAPEPGIDLEFESDVQPVSSEAAMYETCYVTAHKGACRAAAFSRNGQLVATGSVDASIKILDVERMLAKSAVGMGPEQLQNAENHPVIRTLYDHSEDVTCLDFHPSVQILVSGSKDCTVKFYDYSKSSVKRAFKTLQEAEMIRCLSYHPSGEFLLVGTQHSTLRLYDANTCQCFVSANPQAQHRASITSVNYSLDGRQYCSGSKDGDIKLWDGVSNRSTCTLGKAHGGHQVCSVAFSRNSKYVLSSGKDSVVKLWELSMNRVLMTYTGAGSGGQEHRTQAVFNHSEDYILFPDEKTTSLCCWDSRNGERQKLLALGHNNVVRCIVHSPISPGFVTCSDDYRARFWFRKNND